MIKKVEISHKTVIFTVLFIIFLWFLYYIRDIVLQFFGALLLMSILNPLVKRLSKYRVPKIVSILFSYLLFFGLTGLVIAAIVPPLVEQTANLASTLPGYLEGLNIMKYTNADLVKEIVSALGAVPGQIVKAGFSLFANIITVLTIAIFAFYLLLTRDKFDENLHLLFGDEQSKNVSNFIDVLELRLGGWARGQMLLMLIIGVVSYLGYVLLRIPYALPLALLMGIFEIIPFVGPIVASIPAIILGFSISPIVGIAVASLVFLIQQLENYVLVPKIMEKSVGVSPIVTLLALAIGARLAGIGGMIISIPTVIAISALLRAKIAQK